MAGVPVSVQVGSGTSAQRYYYVYDARGDVVNLTDINGNVVASYAYDTWGNLTSASESIPNANGWTNPFRFSGEYGVLYDAADGLYWMSVRAYDPTVGRFISRDPLGRAPLFFADNPYVYAGNNPLSNVDPSGQYRAAGFGSKVHESWKATKRHFARIVRQSGCDKACMDANRIYDARAIARTAAAHFQALFMTPGRILHTVIPQIDPGILTALFGTGTVTAGAILAAIGQLAIALGSRLPASLTFLGALNPFIWVSLLADVVIYDGVAWGMDEIFQREASQSDASWNSSQGLSGVWFATLEVSLLGSAFAGGMLALSIFFQSQFSALWAVFFAVTQASLMTLLQSAQQYIDEEKRVLGY